MPTLAAKKQTNKTNSQLIRVGHSPDADDAFMFYGIKYGKIDTQGLKLVDVIEEIELLNQRALRCELEVTAISVHAYSFLSDFYDIMCCGVSMGDGYGPRLVSKKNARIKNLKGKTIAVPGRFTTAYLLLKLWGKGEGQVRFLPFDEIVPAVQSGEVDCGVVIHEGQILFEEYGLKSIVDLGTWWQEKTKLPIPLGIDVVRKDLGPKLQKKVTGILKKSILLGIHDKRKEAIEYSLKYGRGMDYDTAEEFVGMYVNKWTENLGPKGEKALREILGRAAKANLIPKVGFKIINA